MPKCHFFKSKYLNYCGRLKIITDSFKREMLQNYLMEYYLTWKTHLDNRGFS